MNQSLIADILAFLDKLSRSQDLQIRAKAIELSARLRRNDDYTPTLNFKPGGNGC